MITKRNGNGQTECIGCKLKGKFALTWDSFLYNFNNEPYCFDCLMEKLEELQQRIDKAIEYINKFKVTHDIDGDIAYLDEFHILASPKELLEILKGTSE